MRRHGRCGYGLRASEAGADDGRAPRHENLLGELDAARRTLVRMLPLGRAVTRNKAGPSVAHANGVGGAN